MHLHPLCCNEITVEIKMYMFVQVCTGFGVTGKTLSVGDYIRVFEPCPLGYNNNITCLQLDILFQTLTFFYIPISKGN